MLKGMKAKQQLAAFVALAVGGAFAGAPVAYAAATSVDTNDARMAPATGTSTSTAYQGISGSDSKLLNSVTDNTLTIGTAGATYLPFVTGDVSAGGTTSTTNAVTGNTLIINNINLTGNAYGGIGANQVYTSGTAQTNPNTLTMTGGTVTGSLIGARSIAGGASSGEVTLTGGTVGAGTNAFAIAGGMGHTDAINNKVTLTGGTVTGAVYGGYAENSGAKTTGNTVTLGDASGNYSNGTLSGASIYGGNDSDYTNNRLVVQAKNITADSAQNFATYEFHLNTGIAAGNTMLTLTNGSNALGRTVNIGDIKVDATGWSGAARTAYYGDVGTVTLMADGNTTNNASNLSIAGTSRTGWDGDYEYQITVNPQTSGLTTRNYVRAALHRPLGRFPDPVRRRELVLRQDAAAVQDDAQPLRRGDAGASSSGRSLRPPGGEHLRAGGGAGHRKRGSLRPGPVRHEPALPVLLHAEGLHPGQQPADAGVRGAEGGERHGAAPPLGG